MKHAGGNAPPAFWGSGKGCLFAKIGVQRGLLGGDHLVAPFVEFRVLFLQLRSGEDVLDGVPDALLEADGGRKAGDSPFQLGIVKDHGVGLVADEAAQ